MCYQSFKQAPKHHMRACFLTEQESLDLSSPDPQGIVHPRLSGHTAGVWGRLWYDSMDTHTQTTCQVGALVHMLLPSFLVRLGSQVAGVE